MMRKNIKKFYTYIKSPAGYVSAILALLPIFIESIFTIIDPQIITTKEINVYQDKNIFMTPELESIFNDNSFDNNIIDTSKCIYQIKFENNSGYSIYENDYLEDIIIYTDKNSSIYDVRYIVPDEMKLYFNDKIEIYDNKITIHPFLFNNNEQIDLFFMTDKYANILIQYRINDVYFIYKDKILSDFGLNIMFIRALLVIYLFCFLSMLIYLKSNFNKKPINKLLNL